MTTRRFISFFGAVAFSALFLAGCRAEEQGRITEFKPGIYLGKKDTELSEAQRRQLHQRSAYQGSATFLSRGGGGVAQSGVDTRGLSTRVQGQRAR
ncbi:MAG: hypothetical protein CMM60_08445 [Rhodospirillaceae bacterium]|jgi:hypothetical protein|nr:hypothetical protein [Rhodospirillaceae bacterium]|tara:strand:- start:4439 stop:4726 length:288 start_codon:yes stop_codon:yes gene_type:complete